MAENRVQGVSFRWLLAFAFGVALPAITLGYELTQHGCADDFFDPIPTPFHSALIALAVVANCAALVAIARGVERVPAWLNFLNGAAIAIAGLYAIVFAPMMPLAAIGVLALIGLMPLAPMFTFIVALACRFKLTRFDGLTGGRRNAGWLSGTIAAVLALGGLHGHDYLIKRWIQQASEGGSAEQRAALNYLRRFGGETSVLRACYREGSSAWLDWQARAGSAEQARAVFYRMTGDTFDQRPRPELHSRRSFLFDDFEFSLDENLGGVRVGATQRGLTLATSRMDGLVESDAALAYVEWTLEFQNTSRGQREARAQIALPPGGVVSRVTLWVAGEEREAAFASRGQARQAYQKVAVQERRDPVLVTTSGPDQILVQCFPVPPGGTMKTRIGITAPLERTADRGEILQLPGFVERNFTIATTTRHTVWIESDADFSSCGSGYLKSLISIPDASGNSRTSNGQSLLSSESGELRASRDPGRDKPPPYGLRGEFANAEWTVATRTISIASPQRDAIAWAKIAGDSEDAIVIQQTNAVAQNRPGGLVLVIDGSKSLQHAIPRIAEAISNVPLNLPVRVVFAHDSGATILDGGERGADRALVDPLVAMRVLGGVDASVGLARAWDLAEQRKSPVLWIHGPQPVGLSSLEPLLQRVQRAKAAGPTLFALQVVEGPNRVLEAFEGEVMLKRLRSSGNLAADLRTAFRTAVGDEAEQTMQRRRIVDADKIRLSEKPASKHLARLWVADEVSRLWSERNPTAAQRAVQLAAFYQLVTPATAAVVLETAQQYAQNGLTPVDPATVPTIPEPSTGLALLLAGLCISRRRR